ncbi:hypothetical protein HI914_03909 [Erysiphe necator]|nr:hypothetical protein HI914_03909 [Erysiphe necator]
MDSDKIISRVRKNTHFLARLSVFSFVHLNFFWNHNAGFVTIALKNNSHILKSSRIRPEKKKIFQKQLSRNGDASTVTIATRHLWDATPYPVEISMPMLKSNIIYVLIRK